MKKWREQYPVPDYVLDEDGNVLNGQEWVDNYIKKYNIDVEKLVDNPCSRFQRELSQLNQKDVKLGDVFRLHEKKEWKVSKRCDSNTYIICDNDNYAVYHVTAQQLSKMTRIDRIAMIGKNILYGWLVLAIEELIDISEDGRCTKNWRRAAKVVIGFDYDKNAYLSVNMNGDTSYLSFDCTHDLAVLWQQPKQPFDKYATILAIGDCMEYHSPCHKDKVGQCDWENKTLLSNDTILLSNNGSLQLQDQQGFRQRQTAEDLKHYAIVDRPFLAQAILNNEMLDIRKYGPTRDFHDFYGFHDGYWELREVIIGTRRDLYTINSYHWVMMVHQGKEILLNSSNKAVVLTVYDIEEILEKNNKIWLQYKGIQTYYETPNTKGSQRELENNLNECKNIHMLIPDPIEQEAFKLLILDNVERLVLQQKEQLELKYNDKYVL